MKRLAAWAAAAVAGGVASVLDHGQMEVRLRLR
jgi:hypothetical protein